MSAPHRALKRVKQGEEPSSEIEVFSRKEVLQYQNKALASRLKIEIAENKELTKKNEKLENANLGLLTTSALLYQQLFSINDKLISISNMKGISTASEINLRESCKISENFTLFTSTNLEQIIKESANSQKLIQEAGLNLSKL